MKPITKPQLQKIAILINQFGLQDDKKNIISDFTNGRETSSTKMSTAEAAALLKHLSTFDPLDKMRRKVFALAYDAGIIYGDTPLDKKLNGVTLDKFLQQKGTVKKPLNRLNKDELIKTVSQFQQIIKHNELSEAGKAAKKMLDEVGISTSIRGTKSPL